MSTIAEWLKSLGLSEYAERFAENDIDESVLSDLTEQHLEKLGVSLGHRLKMLYMSQVGESPPRFAIAVNSRTRVTRDYAYFLENRLRARYGMDGVPLIIDFNERKERRGGRPDRAPV